MKAFSPRILPVTGMLAVLFAGVPAGVSSQLLSAARTGTPYSEALPILQALRSDALPGELRGLTPAQIEPLWPQWVARRDASIRARVAEGDEDSIVNLLLLGTSFTTQPRIAQGELAGVSVRAAGSDATMFLPSPVLQARIEDFIAAVASPRGNERLQFAHRVLEGQGLTPATEAGRSRMKTYLEQRTEKVGAAERLSRLDPNADAIDRLTIFRDRGLSSDTSILVDFAIDRALADLGMRGLLRPGSVRRVAIVGPGLDFTDKQGGYDFYPQQTLQPFAIVDSLIRSGLGAEAGVRITAFDLSTRVIQHLEEAGGRARGDEPYALVLPRDLNQAWTADLVEYWEDFGGRIGREVEAEAPPAAAGRVAVRRLLVRPSVVSSVVPHDLNIVLQRLELTAEEQFDLIVATNILLYYDVFEQSLAVANISAMLRPGGVLLSNSRILELPGSPLGSIGHTDVTYMTRPDVSQGGDRIDWYRHR